MEPSDENPGPDLLSLPPAVLHNHVLPLLDAASLLRLGACCRALAAAAHHDELWQHRCEALGWAPHTRGMTWQACYSYRRARLCVECHRPSRYVFTLLGCRLCEACEHQVPRYSLVTRLEAIDRYGVQPAQLATLRYHEACRTAFYLRTQVEALSQSAGGNRRAAAQVESSDEEGEEEEEEEENEEKGQEEGLRNEEDEGGAGSDGEEEGPSVGASAAAQRQAEEKAARKAAKKAAKEAQRMKRQLKATPGGAYTSGAVKITYGQLSSQKAAAGGGTGGRGNGASTSASTAGGTPGRGAGPSGGRGPGDRKQPPQQQKGAARAGAGPSGARAGGGGGGGGRNRRGGQAAGSSPPGLRPAGPLLLALADADGDDGGGQALPLEGQAVPLPRSGGGGGGGGGGRSSRLPKLKSSWAAEREALMAEWGQFGISGLVLAS